MGLVVIVAAISVSSQTMFGHKAMTFMQQSLVLDVVKRESFWQVMQRHHIILSTGTKALIGYEAFGVLRLRKSFIMENMPVYEASEGPP